MKAYSQTAEMLLPVSGNTGYANNSRLYLTLKGVGKLVLDFQEWDISFLLTDPNRIMAAELDIPSGSFELNTKTVSLAMEDSQICFRIAGSGSWCGIQAGLNGGMSGYAQFWMVDPLVSAGLFYDYRVGKEIGLFHDPSIVEYNEIVHRHRLLASQHNSWEEVMANEAEVAASETIPAEWKQRLIYLQSAEAIELEQSIELAQAEEIAAVQLERATRRAQAVAESPVDYDD